MLDFAHCQLNSLCAMLTFQKIYNLNFKEGNNQRIDGEKE